MNITNADWWTIKAMELYGGSFVKALAAAAWHADADNLRKMKEAWGLYWSQYETVGIRMEKNHHDGVRTIDGGPPRESTGYPPRQTYRKDGGESTILDNENG